MNPQPETAHWWGPKGQGRLPFLDWLRGLACLIMLVTHVFDAFLRDPAAAEQWRIPESICAPVFLVLFGITLAFRMGRAEAAGLPPVAGVRSAFRRAAYLGVAAVLYQLARWLVTQPRNPWPEIFHADVLNSMALAALVMAPWALVPAARRIRYSAWAGLVLSLSLPLVAGRAWLGVPLSVREYIVPCGTSYSLFPAAGFIHAGFCLGTMFWRSPVESIENATRWSALAGFAILLACLCIPTYPAWLFTNAWYGDNSPWAVLIHTGIILMLLPLAFLACAGGWGLLSVFVRAMGRNTLLIYAIHMILIYGPWFNWAKRTLVERQCAAVAAALVVVMLGVAQLRVPVWVRRMWHKQPALQSLFSI